MAENSFFRTRWKLLVNAITLLALAVLVYGTRKQVGESFRNMAHVHAWALLLMLPIEVLNYHAQAKLYQGMFRLVGNEVGYRKLYIASLELNFVNHVFPSGGVTGISYWGLRLRDKEITGGKATLIHVMKLALTFLSFEVLLIFGMFSLAIMGRVNSLTILVGGSLSTLLLVGTIGFVYIVGSKERINSFFTAVTRGLNRVIQLVRPHHPETINIDRARGVFDDFHENYRQISQKLGQLKAPFLYAFLANITEVAAIYIVYVAFGHYVNVGGVILAYAVANFAGLVSVLPGGVGVYEALMTAVMATAGVKPGLSLPVTVMYRVVNTLIQIPPGYFFYHRNVIANRRLGKQEA
jgi:uncharacterized protein (TIRG00374 family)